MVPSFHDVISRDEDAVLRPIVLITNSVSGIVDKVQTLLMYWEKKYKHVWEQDKEAYIRCVSLPSFLPRRLGARMVSPWLTFCQCPDARAQADIACMHACILQLWARDFALMKTSIGAQEYI